MAETTAADDAMHAELLRAAAGGGSRRRPASAALSCSVLTAMVVVVLYLATWSFRFYTVHLRIPFSEQPFLSAGAIGYWNRGGSPIDAATTAVGSFEWWVYATDLFDLLVVFWVPSSLVLGLLCALPSLAVTGVTAVLALVFLLQLAKAVYFSLYLFSLFGLLCEQHAFCINRDLALPASDPDPTFWIQTIVTYALAGLTLLLIFLPGVYRSAQRRSLAIGVRYAAAAAKKNMCAESFLGAGASGGGGGGGSSRRRRKARGHTASSICGDLDEEEGAATFAAQQDSSVRVAELDGVPSVHWDV